MNFDKPEELSAHNFDVCDTIGGSSHRNWYMLARKKGCFIGFHNHEWVVLFSSDPLAKWERGCQNSCAYGDPRPQSNSAHFIAFRDIPDEAKPIAIKWYEDLVAECIAKVKSAKEAKERAALADREKKDKERIEQIVNPWLEAIKE